MSSTPTNRPTGRESGVRERACRPLAAADDPGLRDGPGDVPSFAAAAVAPILREEWTVGTLELPFLTVVVQLGFAVGALGLAAIGAPDVISGPKLFAAGALVAAAANLGLGLIANDPASAVPFRFVTGMALAAVYPVAMKLAAGWFRRDRGLAIGVVNGALTVGVALPFLFRAIGAYAGVDWRPVVIAASVAAVAGAILVGVAARSGPLEVAAARFSPAIAAAAFREPSVRLASIGHFGHMWELFAMWTWIPIFLIASFAAAGVNDPALASLTAFTVAPAGGVLDRRSPGSDRGSCRAHDDDDRGTGGFRNLRRDRRDPVRRPRAHHRPRGTRVGRVGRCRLRAILVCGLRAGSARDSWVRPLGPDGRRIRR